MAITLHTLPTTACSCDECKAMCQRPCWPTPEEAKRLIDLGYGDRLMLDCWVRSKPHGGDIDILCPANPGYEGKHAGDKDFFSILEVVATGRPFKVMTGCVFQGGDGLCEIHSSGAKPIEARVAIHGRVGQGEENIHREIANLWTTPEAKELVRKWREQVGLTEEREYLLEEL